MLPEEAAANGEEQHVRKDGRENRRQNAPFANMFYRHNGYTGVSWYCDGMEDRLPDGRICCLYRYEWKNPHPDRKIRQIRLIPEAGAETQILVQRITAIP